MKNIIILLLLIKFLHASDNYYYNNGEVVALEPLVSMLRTDVNLNYYQNSRGVILGVSDKLILKIKEQNSLEKYLDEFNLTIERTLSKNLYLLKTEDKSITIDISNSLYEKKDIEYAHPDFIRKRVGR